MIALPMYKKMNLWEWLQNYQLEALSVLPERLEAMRIKVYGG